MDFMALLDFKRMITPAIIKVIYYLGLLAVLIVGLKIMGGGPFAGVSVLSIIGGLLEIVLGAIVVRVWCELLIVLFKINENLQVIRDSKTGI